MKLTTKGRYAVTAMLDLAIHASDKPISLADISERHHRGPASGCVRVPLTSAADQAGRARPNHQTSESAKPSQHGRLPADIA